MCSVYVCLQRLLQFFIYLIFNVFVFVFVYFAPCNIIYEGCVISFTVGFGNMYL
jgi:hypothetical protein